MKFFRVRPAVEELRRRTAGWRQAGVWGPPLLATLVIACESTNTFSAKHTSDWLRPIFERVFGPFSDQSWYELHHAARKAGHFSYYGLLCLTYLWAWLLTLAKKAEWTFRQWRLRSVGMALLSTFLVASGDEVHQTFIPSRTGKFSDVLIDTAGGAVACMLVWFFVWRSDS